MGPCDECGFDGDLSKGDIEVVWSDLDAPEEDGDAHAEEPAPKWCGTCGHQLEYVVTWADLPDPRGDLPPDAA